MAKEILTPLIHSEVSTIPSTPSAGNVVAYAKDGVIYVKDSNGNISSTSNLSSNFANIWAANTLMNC